MPDRVLVVGLGSVGGVVAGYLSAHPEAEVVGLARRQPLVDHINAEGFQVDGAPGGPQTNSGRALTTLSGDEPPFDYILLATRAPQVEEAARGVMSHLAPDGVMVCLQNGLCEERVEGVVGEGRVFGAVVAWGAATEGPGRYRMTAPAGFRLGRIDGRPDPRLDRLAGLLRSVAPAEVTDNLAGARWSKLAMNACGSALSTLSGTTLGVAVRRRTVRLLSLEIITEVVLVTRALGVELEPLVKGLDLDWLAMVDAEGRRRGFRSRVPRNVVMLLIGQRFRKVRSSMLRAMERGEDPGIETLNGEIVDRGERVGVPTPANAAVVEAIRTASRGEAELGFPLVNQVAARVGRLA